MSNAPAAGLLNESLFMQGQIRRHSTVFNDSSDSEREGGPTNEVVILEPTPVKEFFMLSQISSQIKTLHIETINSNRSEKIATSKLWPKLCLTSIWMTKLV